jgi:heme/copper-type cytochrome/quinol oxidase subunit 3
LWDQARLDEGNPVWVQLVHALEHYPTKWRATLVTSLVEGVPEGIVRLAGPSILPFAAALGVMVVFAAEIYSAHPVAIASALLTIGAVVAWMWPPRIEREFRLDDEGRPTIHGLPIYLAGPRSPGWWGMLFTLLVLGVGSACLVFSYFYLKAYLKAQGMPWPPPSTPRPGLLLPLANLLVLLALSAGLFWALRSVRRYSSAGLLVGTSASLALGLLFLVIQGVEFTQWGWTPNVNAYTSAFGTLAGLQFGLVAFGLILSGVTTLQAFLGYFNGWRYLAVENLRNYWVFVTAHWAVLLLVLYVV